MTSLKIVAHHSPPTSWKSVLAAGFGLGFFCCLWQGEALKSKKKKKLQLKLGVGAASFLLPRQRNLFAKSVQVAGVGVHIKVIDSHVGGSKWLPAMECTRNIHTYGTGLKMLAKQGARDKQWVTGAFYLATLSSSSSQVEALKGILKQSLCLSPSLSLHLHLFHPLSQGQRTLKELI